MVEAEPTPKDHNSNPQEKALPELSEEILKINISVDSIRDTVWGWVESVSDKCKYITD